MKIDVNIKDNKKFKAKINRTLTGDQYILTIDTNDKLIDIIFEDYDELKKMHDLLSKEVIMHDGMDKLYETITEDEIKIY